MRHSRGDELHHSGLEEIGPGVDGIGDDLVPGRLFQEALDPAVLGRLHEAVERGVLDPGEREGRFGAVFAVKLQEGGDVQGVEDVSVEDQEGVVQALGGVADGPAGAQGLFFVDVAQLHAQAAPISEGVFEIGRTVGGAEADFPYAVAAQDLELILKEGAVDHRQERLGGVAGQGAQARPFSSDEDHRFHRHGPPSIQKYDNFPFGI